MANFLERLGLKRLNEIRHPGKSVLFFSGRPEDSEIQKDVGAGTSANVLMTPIRWIQREFAEAPLVIQDADGELNSDHELARLIRSPNEFYTGNHLFAATILSLVVDGNAYWLCVRNRRGQIIQLWYAPHHTIEPKFPDDGSQFLTHYEYTVGGRKARLEVEDVIHFRDGLDPDNIRKGLSPIKSLMKEIWTDTEAAMMVAALMKNGGVPGVIISPDNDEPIDDEDAEATKQYIRQNFTRERRGNTLVMKGRTKVSTFGFSPQQMDLSKIRNISEERVTAALGVRAAIVGFGTGIQQSKVGATMKEESKLSWRNGIIPLQRIFAQEIENRLLPLIDPASGLSVVFDNSGVSALQEDETAKVERVNSLVKSGIWTRGEGREATGREALPADDVFLIPINTLEVPRAGQRQAPQPEERSAMNEPDQKAWRSMYSKSGHSLTEDRVSETAPVVREPPRSLVRMNAAMTNIRNSLPPLMQRDLEDFFEDLGAAAEREAEPFTKTAQDDLDSSQIVEAMGIGAVFLPTFKRIYERHFLRVATEINDLFVVTLNLAASLPDPVEKAVLQAGGTRLGLVDLSKQSKRAIFAALVEGREEGLAGDELARSIRDKVEAGPWSSPAVRARVIAQTETTFAVNKSSIEMMKATDGVQRALIFDDKTGYSAVNPSHTRCADVNGRVVSLQDAEQLMIDEHPNGSRSASPITDQLAQEMGL